MSDNDESGGEYLVSLNGAEWFAIIARNNLGFRYGPYTGEEVGKIMSQCVEEGIPLMLTANCGREFDWDVARDFGRGEPANWRPMDQAPQDGTVIIGDVNGFEQRMCWWIKWECWRAVADNGSDIGQPVHPYRWRSIDDEFPA